MPQHSDSTVTIQYGVYSLVCCMPQYSMGCTHWCACSIGCTHWCVCQYSMECTRWCACHNTAWSVYTGVYATIQHGVHALVYATVQYGAYSLVCMPQCSMGCTHLCACHSTACGVLTGVYATIYTAWGVLTGVYATTYISIKECTHWCVCGCVESCRWRHGSAWRSRCTAAWDACCAASCSRSVCSRPLPPPPLKLP